MTREEAGARRAALREACAICDDAERLVRQQNPGRKRGSTSHVGDFAATFLKECADKINALRDATAAAPKAGKGDE